MTVLVAVFGRKERGKTTVIESLIRILSQDGKKVTAVKHVYHPDFTMDVRGKDTWRFSNAGAKRVMVISPSETATIEKIEMPKDVDEIMKRVNDGTQDVIFFEGFFQLLKNSNIVKKIVVGSRDDDVSEILEECSEPLIGIVAPFGVADFKKYYGAKLYVLPKDTQRLLHEIMRA